MRDHFKSIYGKLDAHSRVQAAELAREFNLLEFNSPKIREGQLMGRFWSIS